MSQSLAKPRRKIDPEEREMPLPHHDSSIPFVHVDGKKDDRVYKYVNKDDGGRTGDVTGLGFAKATGWQVERARAGGPRPFANEQEDGEILECLGQVLVSMDETKWKRQQEEGVFGNGGLRQSRARHQQLRGKRTLLDNKYMKARTVEDSLFTE